MDIDFTWMIVFYAAGVGVLILIDLIPALFGKRTD